MFFFIFSFISCDYNEFTIADDISRIEQILEIKISNTYEILDQENSYPIKGDIIHFVSFKFHKLDYETILNSAILFFSKPVYDPLNPNKDLNMLYYEIEENNSRYSIYIDLKSEIVNYTFVDLK